jgi:hypothetical protein
MQKQSKGADPYPAMDCFIARAVNHAGPDGNAGDPKLLTVLGDYLVLFKF